MSEYTELVERAEFAATSAKNSAAQTKSDKDTVVSLYNEIKAIVDAGGGSGGSCKFYECTSVGDSTWSGYEWLLTTRVTEPEPTPVTSFTISDSGIDGLDGTFTVDTDASQGRDKSVYINGAGKYCWWYEVRKQWCITASIGNVGTVYAGAGYPNGSTDFGEPWEGWTWYNDINGDVVNSTIKVLPITQEQEPIIDKVYEKSNDITPGLSWTSVKPKIGNSYSSDALIKAVLYQGSPNIPDMVFYSQLDSVDVQLGEQFVNHNSVVFVEQDGITCAKFTGNNMLKTTNAAPSGTEQLTMSFWCKAEYANSGHWFVLGLGKGGYQQNFNAYYYDTTGFDLSLSNYELQATDIMTQTDWNFITMVSTGSSVILYINGKAVLSDVFSGFNLASGDLELGRTDGHNASSCYIAGLRIFTRALTDSEITALYQEYAGKLRP